MPGAPGSGFWYLGLGVAVSFREVCNVGGGVWKSNLRFYGIQRSYRKSHPRKSNGKEHAGILIAHRLPTHFSCTYPLRQHHLNHLAVCLTQSIRHRLRIDV